VAHEDRAPVLWLRLRSGEWRRVAGQPRTPTYAAASAGLFAAAGGPLLRFATPDGPAEPVAGVDGATTVCSGGHRVVAVRSSRAGGGGRLWQSDDDGAHFVETPGVSLPSTLCAVSGDGTIWIAAEGFFAGALAVATAGGAFVERSLPAPRIEALVVDPADGNHGWIGTWGGGVHRTRDGGKSWESMGLAGSEVSALVIDFARNIAWAGTGSGVFELNL
jgi:hypothetical protein